MEVAVSTDGLANPEATMKSDVATAPAHLLTHTVNFWGGRLLP